jgi:isopentenyl diphosphate isomerase/L-lactate dehydrogenase-like FMN-dependent dehydrogenase
VWRADKRRDATGRGAQTPSAGLRYRDQFDSVAEAERVARRRLPRAMFDRLMGGAENGITARANVEAFSRVWFRPRGAAASPERTTRTKVAGVEIDVPILLAPIGALRLQHPDGVLAALAAASRCGTVCAVSPACGHAIDAIDLPAGSMAWYQVTTALAGREGVERDIEQVKARGYQAIVVTIDSVLRPKAAPIRINARSAVQFAPDLVRHPKWTYGFVRDGMRLSIANKAIGAVGAPTGARPVRWDDFAWIREQWSGPLVVKGVMTADDARRAEAAGADVIVVSNHGGLTLDGSAPTLRALPDVLAAVGDGVDVLLDGGVRGGADAVKAIALGARAVLVGRAYVVGLAVGGEHGVARILEIMREDVDRTLAFLGCASLGEVGRSHVDVGALA